MAVQRLRIEKKNHVHSGAEMGLCHQDGVLRGCRKARENVPRGSRGGWSTAAALLRDDGAQMIPEYGTKERGQHHQRRISMDA